MDFKFINIESLRLWFGRSKSVPDHAKSSALECAKSLVCNLQAAFAEYTVLSSCHHKTMREIWEKTHRPCRGLEEARLKLYNYLYLEFLKACRICGGQAENYFRGRSSIPARFCVKLPYDGMLVDAYRGPVSEKNQVAPADNTAFNYVQETGRYFLSNDLLQEIFSPRGYQNPRLNVAGVRANYHSSFDGKTPAQRRKHDYYKKTTSDPAWESFWKTHTGNSRPGPQCCYKSTLVIPMTLINADLSPEFRSLILDESSATDFEKLNFGFVCFDHPHTDFFAESDIAFGYIMADFLSLFLITQREKTVRSPTSQDIDSHIGKIDQLLAAPLRIER